MHRPPQIPSLASALALQTTEVRVGAHQFSLVHPASVDELLDREEFTRDDRLPYWAEIWPSAPVLAQRILLDQGRGRRLLELGSGVGLVALAAAQAGFDVLATDVEPTALDFLHVNALRNRLPDIETRIMDWRHLPADLGPFDVVAGSDVLYERPLAALIAHGLSKTIAPGGIGLIADPGRSVARPLVDECHQRGLEANCVATVPVENDGKPLTVELFEIRHRS